MSIPPIGSVTPPSNNQQGTPWPDNSYMTQMINLILTNLQHHQDQAAQTLMETLASQMSNSTNPNVQVARSLLEEDIGHFQSKSTAQLESDMSECIWWIQNQ